MPRKSRHVNHILLTPPFVVHLKEPINASVFSGGQQDYMLVLVSHNQTTFFFYIGAGKKGSGTLPIETAVLASTLVGVSVKCDSLDVLNAIDRDAASCESR